MKAQLFTLEPGDRFRFTNDKTIYKAYILDISDDHGIEVVFLNIATEKAYKVTGSAIMNEVIIIN